jgi:hypothetical protein
MHHAGCAKIWLNAEYHWQHIGRQMAETYEWILNGGTKPEWIISE